jgi:transposase
MSRLIIEPKRMPNTIPCPECGNKMDWISVELGYSCRTDSCPMQVETITDLPVTNL